MSMANRPTHITLRSLYVSQPTNQTQLDQREPLLTASPPDHHNQLARMSSVPIVTPSIWPPFHLTTETRDPLEATEAEDGEPRLPRSVQALYMQPLRRECEYGVPSADLQLRSFTLPNLEFFSDFALRAAYYLGLPAFGPVPLPRITERWTVPRSHFIYKKSQENYERITLRRLIQIRDGHPETVQLWLAYLQKHAYPGLGMKANIFEFDRLGVFFFIRFFSSISKH